MNRTVAGQTAKELGITFLLVSAIAIPLIVAIAGGVLWIETGSPWAGPVVIGALAAMLAAGLSVTQPWKR